MAAYRIKRPTARLDTIVVRTRKVGIKIKTLELAQQARETKEKITQLATEAMGEYIDLFTEPIWEQEEEEEEEE